MGFSQRDLSQMLRCESIAGRSYSCARCNQQPWCLLNPSREVLLLVLTLIALLTIMMASWRDRSVSSMNCSAPPRRIIVQVFAFGQPVKKLYLPMHDTRRTKEIEKQHCSSTGSAPLKHHMGAD